MGMEEMTVPLISIELRRIGHLIIIEGLDTSVSFYPADKNKTFKEILEKCKEFGYNLTENNPECVQELSYIDSQLTEIYKTYEDEASQKRDPELLLDLLQSEVKDQFRDETGAHYVIIERDDHPDIRSIDSEEFDMFMRAIFYKNTGRVIGKESVTNTKMLLKSFTNKQKILYNRCAKIGTNIFYDLGNQENRKCIKVTKESWSLIDNPCIFRRSSCNDSTQVFPVRSGLSKRYLRDILDKTTIKYRHQKLIAEVYVISLFISNISHPIILAIGPPGSGKTVLLRTIKLIVDPRNEIESLVQRLPREARDRRVNIHKNYISYFDNEGKIEPGIMDEMCTWVTGYLRT